MEIINNRFRVIRHTGTYNKIDSYEVLDLWDEDYLRELKIINREDLDDELSLFLKEWLLPINKSMNPYFNSIIIFDNLEFENSRSVDDGRIILVSETSNYYESVNTLSKKEKTELNDFLEGGRVFLEEAGLDLKLSYGDIQVINNDGNKSFIFNDLFTIKLNNKYRRRIKRTPRLDKIKYKPFIEYGRELKKVHDELASHKWVEDEISKLTKENKSFGVISVKGKGPLKTDLLRQIRVEELVNNSVIFSDFTLGKLNDDKFWENLIYRFFQDVEQDKIYIGNDEDLNFLYKMKAANKLGGKSNLQKKMPGIKSIMSYLMYYVTNRKINIIIDNLHLAEDIVLEFLTLLLSKFHNNWLNFIFSYDENAAYNNESFMKLLKLAESYKSLKEFSLASKEGSPISLNNFTDKEMDVLKVISVFKESVPSEYVEIITGYIDSRDIIAGLITSRVLEVVPVAGMVAFSFTRPHFKREILETLSLEEIRAITSKSIEIVKENEENNYDEILYQLEISGNYEEYKNYLLYVADKLKDNNDAEGAIYYYSKALYKSDDIEDIRRIYQNIAESYLSLGDYTKLEEVLDDMVLIIEETGDLKLRLIYYETNIAMALFNYDMAKYESFASIFKSYVDESGDEIYHIKYLRYKAEAYQVNLEYDKALDIYRKIIEISDGVEELNNVVSYSLRALGMIQFFRSDNKSDREGLLKASDLFDKARKFARKVGDVNSEIKCISNIATVRRTLGNYREAKLEYSKALQISEKLGMIDNQILLLLNLARTDEILGEYESGYKYALRALKLLEGAKIEGDSAFALATISLLAHNMNFIDECVIYFDMLDKSFKAGNFSQHELWQYYRTYAMFLTRIMDYEKANQVIKEIYKFSGAKKEEEYIVLRLLEFLYDVAVNDDFSSVDEIVGIIRGMADREITAFNITVNYIFEGLFYIFKRVKVDSIRPIMDACISLKDKIYEEYDSSQYSIMNKAYMTHFEFLNGERNIRKLTNAMVLCREDKYFLLKLELLTHQAVLYLEKGLKEYAISFLLEANYHIEKLMENISDKNKLAVFNGRCMYFPLKLLENTLNNEGFPEMLHMASKEEMKDLLDRDFLKEVDINLIKETVLRYQKYNYTELYGRDFIIEKPFFYFKDSPRENTLICLQYFSDNSLSRNATCYIFTDSGEPVEYIKLYDSDKDYSDEDIKRYILDWKKNPQYKKIDVSREGSVGTNSIVIFPLYDHTELQAKELAGALVLEYDRAYNNSDEEHFISTENDLKLLSFSLLSDVIRKESQTDKLTGLLSRKRFEELANELINKSEATVYFLLFDIDKFKKVNDSYGHRFGDSVLKIISSRVSSLIGEEAILGRIGGEEFMLIVEGVMDIESYAENIRIAVSQIDYEQLGEPDLNITISIGISIFPENGTDYKTLYENADRAMYKSKEDGRNRATFYDKTFTKRKKNLDELAGILVEDEILDARNVRTLIEIIRRTVGEGLVDSELLLLRTLKSLMNADFIALLEIGSGQAEVSLQITDIENMKVNINLLDKILENGRPFTLIDWDSVVQLNKVTGVPEWHSVMLLSVKYDCNFEKIIYI